MEKTSYIGIDLGTSGCRACVISTDGIIVAEHTLRLPTPWRDGDEVFQDPNSWWDGLAQLLGGLLDKLTDEQRINIESLTIDGTSGTVLLADEELTPQSVALMYNDSASIVEAERIAEFAPADSPARSTTSGLAKLLRLLPDYEADIRVHSQSDWLLHRLLGRRSTMDSNNALKLGWDAVKCEWPAWMERLELPNSVLPEVVPAGTPLGTIAPEVAEYFGLPDSLTICAGTTDSTAAFIASGASLPGEAVTALGSTLVLKVVAKQPVFAPEYGIYSQPLGDLWLVGGASNSGGAVLRHFFSDQQMASLSEQINPDLPSGLDYYPLPATGERFPVCDPQWQPRLTPRPTNDARFFQGLLEGISRIEKMGYDKLAGLGAPYPVSVRSNGGGARNDAWTRIRGEMLGVPMLPAMHSEAAYGAALLARNGATTV
jgi:sugar (pentulose or hexulose) kinase